MSGTRPGLERTEDPPPPQPLRGRGIRGVEEVVYAPRVDGLRKRVVRVDFPVKFRRRMIPLGRVDLLVRLLFRHTTTGLTERPSTTTSLRTPGTGPKRKDGVL